MSESTAHDAIEAVARDSYGRLVAYGCRTAGPGAKNVAKRLGCVELAPALVRLGHPQSASKLDALQTLPESWRRTFARPFHPGGRARPASLKIRLPTSGCKWPSALHAVGRHGRWPAHPLPAPGFFPIMKGIAARPVAGGRARPAPHAARRWEGFRRARRQRDTNNPPPRQQGAHGFRAGNALGKGLTLSGD